VKTRSLDSLEPSHVLKTALFTQKKVLHDINFVKDRIQKPRAEIGLVA